MWICVSTSNSLPSEFDPAWEKIPSFHSLSIYFVSIGHSKWKPAPDLFEQRCKIMARLINFHVVFVFSHFNCTATSSWRLAHLPQQHPFSKCLHFKHTQKKQLFQHIFLNEYVFNGNLYYFKQNRHTLNANFSIIR